MYGIVAGEALVVDARDKGAVQARHQLVLAHEALEEHRVVAQRAVQHLERDAQPVVLALGEEYLRLAALADDMNYVVAGNGLLCRHWPLLYFRFDVSSVARQNPRQEARDIADLCRADRVRHRVLMPLDL